jgi:hypothetical protein
MKDHIDENWVTVGTYRNTSAAHPDSALLTSMKIPNRVQMYGTVDTIECYLWVPREFRADAEKALKPTISEAQLTAEALKETPPDDA